uniref:Uncharacterized protein n=1 Tax=Rhizophora mucronata TaxID=61149 RepID=A0A2P2J2H0_RHIMU
MCTRSNREEKLIDHLAFGLWVRSGTQAFNDRYI